MKSVFNLRSSCECMVVILYLNSKCKWHTKKSIWIYRCVCVSITSPMALASYTNLTHCNHSVMCSKKSPGQMYCGTYATGSCAGWAKGKLTEGNRVQIANTTRSRLQIVALPVRPKCRAFTTFLHLLQHKALGLLLMPKYIWLLQSWQHSVAKNTKPRMVTYPPPTPSPSCEHSLIPHPLALQCETTCPTACGSFESSTFYNIIRV